VIIAVVWLGIALAVAAIEVTSRRSGRLVGLRELGSRIASRRIGRLVVVACWAFIGWHVFARYTVPPL
jgi:hypothetical protein